MVKRAILLALIFSILLAEMPAAVSFTTEITNPQMSKSILDNVDEISTKQIYGAITASGTWHYFLTTAKAGQELQVAPEINAVGFVARNTRLLTMSVSYSNLTERWNETECREIEVCKNVVETDENGKTSIRRECRNETVCEEREYSQTTQYATYTEDERGSVKVLGILTNIWAKGRFNPEISACGTLSDPNVIYTLTDNINESGSTCLTVAAANVTLDCNGFSITGNNTASTYGIYSTQNYTTIKNCNISNFGYEIYLSKSNNSVISNTSANSIGTTASFYPVVLNALTNLSASDMSVSAVGANVIGFVLLGVSDSSFSNINTSATAKQAFSVQTNSNRNVFNHIISNGTDATYGSFLIYNGASNNTIANSTIYSGASTNGIRILTGTNPGTQIINTTINVSGSGIYDDSGSNLHVDCQGATMSGSNASYTYGVYFNQNTATIANCNITNFAEGVSLFNGGDNTLIENNTISTTSTQGSGYSDGIFAYSADNSIIRNNVITTANGGAGINLATTTYAQIYNNTVTTTNQPAIYFRLGANYNNVSNSSFTCGNCYGALYADGTTSGAANNRITYSNFTSNYYGIYLNLGANYNTFDHVITSSSSTSATSSIGMIIFRASNFNNVSNSFIYGNNSLYAPLTLGASAGQAGAASNRFENNTIDGLGGQNAIDMHTGTSNANNVFINNTLLNTTVLVNLKVGAGNTFYWNNFTNSPKLPTLYVNDTAGGNFYNSSAEGNIWGNVMNGSVAYTGTTPSTGFPSLYIADAGANLPYNATVSAKVVGVQDWHPLTPTQGGVIITPPTSNITYPTNASTFTGQEWMNFSMLGTDAQNATLNATLYINNSINATNESMANNTAWLYNATLGYGAWTAILQVCSVNNCTNSTETTFQLNAVVSTFANLTVLCSTGGASCVGNVTNLNITAGANSSINATASANYTFSNWTVTSGNCTITNASNNVSFAEFLSATSNCEATAYFSEIIIPTGNLTVLCGVGGTSCSGNATNATVNTSLPINATAGVNYTFSVWDISGNCTVADANSNSTTAQILSGECTLTANFTERPEGTLSVLSAGNGSASGNMTERTPFSTIIIATPENTSFIFQNWTLDGNCSANNASSNNTTITLFSGNCNATASFTSTVNCNFTYFDYSPYMTPDGTIFHSATNPASMINMFNATVTNPACTYTINVTLYGAGGELLSYTLGAANQQNITVSAIPVNRAIHVNATAMLSNGIADTSRTKDYYMVLDNVVPIEEEIDMIGYVLAWGGGMFLCFTLLRKQSGAIAGLFMIFISVGLSKVAEANALMTPLAWAGALAGLAIAGAAIFETLSGGREQDLSSWRRR